MTQRGKCSLYRRPRKGFSLRVRLHFLLIQNHWSCIWVSIIQQERGNPLWAGSRYWTLHYLLDRGIAGRRYIPPERLFWDQAPAAPLMTPSISWGPPATQIQRFYNLYTSAFVTSLLRRPPWPTWTGGRRITSHRQLSKWWFWAFKLCSGSSLYYWSTHHICHCKWTPFQCGSYWT